MGLALKWLPLFLIAAFAVWRWRMSEARLVLAQTIYGEARGEGYAGMAAVANVVMNRVAIGGWWGDNVIAVCKAPWQFSAWNEGDPNRRVIEAMRPGDNAVFDMAYEIAGKAVAGTLPDITGGATHYYARGSIAEPSWARGAVKTASLGGHDFFSGVA